MARVPEKVVLSHDGRDYEARFTVNALCSVEQAMGGLSLEQIGAELKAGTASFALVRAVFRAVLLDAMPALTDIGAGRILSDIGAPEASRVLQGAFDNLKAGTLSAPVDLPELDTRGRLAFEAGGVRYVLAFHFNALAEMESVFPGLSMQQIALKLHNEGVGVCQIRAMFRAAAIDDRELSLFEAGELMDRIGLALATAAVGKSFVGAFPKVPQNDGDQGDEGEGTGNRQQRRAAKSGSGNPTKAKRPQRKAGTGTR